MSRTNQQWTLILFHFVVDFYCSLFVFRVCYDVEKSEKIFLASYCLKKNCSARAHLTPRPSFSLIQTYMVLCRYFPLKHTILTQEQNKGEDTNTDTEVVVHERIPFTLLSRELGLKTSSYCDVITRTSLFPLWLYE